MNNILVFVFLVIFLTNNECLYTYDILYNLSILNYNIYMISILVLNSFIIISKIIANFIYIFVAYFATYAPIDEY